MKQFKIHASNAPDRKSIFIDILKNGQRMILNVEDTPGTIPVTAWAFRDAIVSLIQDHAEEFENELFYDINE